MANIYNHHHRHLRHKTTVFLPMLCGLSLKDINLSHHHRYSALSDDPSSPKVSCMGQVKRNNRVAAASAAAHQYKHSKLKKLFSGKALLPPAAVGGCGRSGSKSCRSRKELCGDNLRRLRLTKDSAKVVDVRDLDPPLPVKKWVAPPGGGGGAEVNLWRRRFNGSVEIGKIHIPNCKISQLPTV